MARGHEKTGDSAILFMYRLLRNTIILLLISRLFLLLLLYKRSLDFIKEKTFLLVTAHPDDESMFFAPFLYSGAKVHILCLTGDETRRKELEEALLFLKFSSLKILDEPDLPDSMNATWGHVERFVQPEVEKHAPDFVVTFDDWGISGHPNHRSLGRMKLDSKVLHLHSTNVLSKYNILSILFPRSDSLVFLSPPWFAFRAMQHHRSQMLWFRYLYLLFSRYTILNELIFDR